jgi:ribosomal protein S18 acetylase RimI-like enzyme
VEPTNEAAIGLYRSFGFEFTGAAVDGEHVMLRPGESSSA